MASINEPCSEPHPEADRARSGAAIMSAAACTGGANAAPLKVCSLFGVAGKVRTKVLLCDGCDGHQCGAVDGLIG